MAELMGMILRVRDFLDAHHTLVATAMAALLAMIIALSRRLRAREMETLTLLGSGRGFQWALQATELAIVLSIAIVCAWGGCVLTVRLVTSYLHTLTG